MKARTLRRGAAAGLALAALAALALAQKDPRTLKFADIVFKPQRPAVLNVKTGVQLYAIEDHETPTVNAFLIFKTGSLADPAGKEGLAGLTLDLLKSGGTQTLTPEAVEEKLDFLGSTLSFRAGDEFSTASLWSLSKNFEATWALLADLLFNPAFDPGRFDLAKKQELETIRRRWDQPMSVGMYLFQELLYGKGFPDARRTTSASIESVTLDDVRGFYESQIKDREVVLGFAGGFSSAKLTPLLKSTFKKWKGTPAARLDLPKAQLASRPGLYLIDKPDLTQAIIAMGHLGINRLDPDNVEINIMNFILGSGGFNSRLMREVRSNRGLAYETFGSVNPGRDRGDFFAFCQTKNASVAEAITIMKGIIEDMTVNPVTAGELETAKKYEQNAFVHRFDGPLAVLRQFIYQKLQGYPNDYLETYLARIQKVDAAKVLEMAKRTMIPRDLVILVVGKKAEILEPLKGLNLGPVTELPLPKE
jgi:zinc protease